MLEKFVNEQRKLFFHKITNFFIKTMETLSNYFAICVNINSYKFVLNINTFFSCSIIYIDDTRSAWSTQRDKEDEYRTKLFEILQLFNGNLF